MSEQTESQESNLARYGKEALMLVMQGVLIGLGGILANKAVSSFSRRTTRELAGSTNNILDLHRSKTG